MTFSTYTLILQIFVIISGTMGVVSLVIRKTDTIYNAWNIVLLSSFVGVTVWSAIGFFMKF